MNVLLTILRLLPYVVAGVQAVHTDLSTDQKIQATNDIIGISAAAVGAVSPSNADAANALGTEATSTISALVAALHGKTAVAPTI